MDNKRTRTKNRTNPNTVGTVQHSLVAAKKENIPSPIEVEDKKALVIKWGERNEYPYFLNYLFNKNAIHSGILRSKTRYICAGGLEYTGPNPQAWELFYKNKKRTHKDKNLDQLIKDIVLDYEKSNLIVFKVVFSFVNGKTYRKLKRIPFEQVRFQIRYDKKQKVVATGNICVSKDWLTDKPEYDTLEPYKEKDPNQTACYVIHQEESGQALDYIDAKTVNAGFYPDAPYGGAIKAIDTGIQIQTYQNSEIANGFSLGTMLYFANGKFKNQQEKRRFENDLGEAATGAGQAGRLFTVYGNGQDQKPEATALNGNNLADRYNNTKDGSEDSIIHGHSVVVPTLFGKKQEGSFNASELEVGFAIMKQNYFAERQAEVLQVLNWIMNEIAGIEGEITFKDKPLELPSEAPEAPAAQMNINLNSQEDTKKDTVLERLKMTGRQKDGVKVLTSYPVKVEPMTDAEVFAKVKAEFAKLGKDEQQALGLINNGQPFNEVRKALEVSGNDLAKIYKKLINEELITPEGKVTELGREQIAIDEAESLKIMYEYRLRPDAPALVEGGQSRDFCQTLMSLNRLYTIEEINLISGAEGYNVFAYKGGWYHNPNTRKNEPACRHEWSQVVTFQN